VLVYKSIENKRTAFFAACKGHTKRRHNGYCIAFEGLVK